LSAILVALLGLLLGGCRPGTPSVNTGAPAPGGSATALFVNVAEQAGVRFAHQTGATGKFWFIENTPGGCAFLDYDNDGFLDLFLVQSGPSDPPAEPPKSSRPFCALYHNNGDGTFTDVTAGSGFDRDLGYLQGVTVGDYDNDGYPDLFLAGYNAFHLFRNAGGRATNPKPLFEDVTARMGLDKLTGYGTSAAFGDYNNDGRLDLYICFYVAWSHATNIPCSDAFGLEYCSPQLYDPMPHRLFRNDGSRFTDVSAAAGITKEKGRGLSVAFVDYNNDGKQDIFVANDLTPNLLWRNNGNGTFTNVAVQAGCAYDETGAVMAGMGIAIADYDRSGNESLFVGNFSDMPNMLYKNLGNGTFQSVAYASGLALPHMKFLTFGTEFLDYDNDGWQDLLVINGHVQAHADLKYDGITYKERKQLFQNRGDGTFTEITDPAQLGGLSNPTVGRGLAIGDFDNDGRVDALVSSQNDPAELFHNQAANPHHWVGFLTVGTKSNRDGRHARFTLTAGGVQQTGVVRAGSSYLSGSDRRIYFGLGSSEKLERVEIVWPSGTKEVLTDIPANAIHIVTEGRGITGQLPAAKSANR
jgi:hypothetical protein